MYAIAAKVGKEPNVPIFCDAANVWFGETDKLVSVISGGKM
jgi:hypothetical protein